MWCFVCLQEKVWLHRDASDRKPTIHLSAHVFDLWCLWSRKEGSCTLLLYHRNRLTFLSNQFHLNTIFSMLTAITALVRGFKLIDANREVSTRAPVGEGFHSALFGVRKPNLAFGLKVDQVCLLNFAPWHRFRLPSREAAWQEHRGVEGSAKSARLTEIWFLARQLLIWMETERKKSWIYLLSKLKFSPKIYGTLMHFYASCYSPKTCALG